jgi:hypothetical protein
VVVDLRRGDERAPVFDVDGVGRDEADVPVDAGAGVPARGGLPRVVGADGDDVRLAEVQMFGQLVAEADVTVGPFAKMMPVDPHVAVRHHAVELDEDAALRVLCGEVEVLAVPADARGQVAAVLARGVLLVERPLDAPVVRHVETAPGRVVELGPLGARPVALEEAPVGVEVHRDARRARPALRERGRRERERRQQQQECGRDSRSSLHL